MQSLLPRGILFAAFCLLLCLPALSQSSTSGASEGSASPFEVAITVASQADYDACSGAGFVGKTDVVGLDMRNSSGKPLRGYVLAVWYHNVGSRVVMHQTVSKLVHPGEAMITPGAEWHSAACGISKLADLDDPKAQVDFLMYEDGETWGPAELVESNHLDGVSIGMSFAAGGDNQQRGYVTATPVAQGATGEAIPTEGPSSPLKFYGMLGRDDSGVQLLIVQAANAGDVPVVGYEYTITFYDRETHDAMKNVTTKAMETHGDAQDYLQPGATWASGGRKIPDSSNGEPATYTVRLDAVVFADGSVSGPRRSREADELIGMIEGIGAIHLSPAKTPAGLPAGGVVGGALVP